MDETDNLTNEEDNDINHLEEILAITGYTHFFTLNLVVLIAIATFILCIW